VRQAPGCRASWPTRLHGADGNSASSPMVCRPSSSRRCKHIQIEQQQVLTRQRARKPPVSEPSQSAYHLARPSAAATDAVKTYRSKPEPRRNRAARGSDGISRRDSSPYMA